MPLTVKARNTGQSFKALIDETLSPKARSEKIAGFARRQIKAADEINKRAFGKLPPKTVTVNGKEDPLLSNVPPDKGVIHAHYELVGEVLIWIMNRLKEQSPVLSGAYRNGHKLYADGIEVNDTRQAPPAAKYTFFNEVPYARRLEVGKTKTGRAFLVSVPNRIYERTARAARSRFGNAVIIEDGFSSTVWKKGVPKFKRRRKRYATSSIPAIFVRIG